MYSQMHQPDILLLVKESLSVSRESTLIHLTARFLSLLTNSIIGNLTCLVLSSALFVDLEADFHARVPVVICKEKNRCVSLVDN